MLTLPLFLLGLLSELGVFPLGGTTPNPTQSILSSWMPEILALMIHSFKLSNGSQKHPVISPNPSEAGHQHLIELKAGLEDDRLLLQMKKLWSRRNLPAGAEAVSGRAGVGDGPVSSRSMGLLLISVQFSSAAQSCPILCDTMDCSTPGLPVRHQLPESTQNHVH